MLLLFALMKVAISLDGCMLQCLLG